MRAAAPDPGALPLRLFRDHLYLDAAAYAHHLAKVQTVVLLRDGRRLMILPVAHVEAGGFLVKQINARGDRAIHAADFFRLNGLDDQSDLSLMAFWSETEAAYVIADLFAD